MSFPMDRVALRTTVARTPRRLFNSASFGPDQLSGCLYIELSKVSSCVECLNDVCGSAYETGRGRMDQRY